MTSDRQLMQQVQAGDAAAFDALFARHERLVRRRLLAVVRDEATADDLAQEAFLRLWTRATQWQGRGSVVGWLLRTATNLGLNHLRTVRRRRIQPLELPDDIDGDEDEGSSLAPGWMIDTATLRPDEALEHAERQAILRNLVDSLPETQRDVIRMVHEMELDIRETADELRVPTGTVKSRLHHARGKLARGWQKWHGSTEHERE